MPTVPLTWLVLVGVGLWIRLGILETPVFTRLLAERRTATAPVAEVLRKNWRQVILTCLLRTGQQAPFYIFWTYVLLYATNTLGPLWLASRCAERMRADLARAEAEAKIEEAKSEESKPGWILPPIPPAERCSQRTCR